MMKNFVVEEAVKGELGIGGKNVSYDFKAGAVTPKDQEEEAVLLKLVSLGLAKVGSPKPQSVEKPKAVEATETKEG
jgi:hypothetical protein